MNQAYSMPGALPVSQVGVETRATFITKTYAHLLGAIVAFVGLEVFLFTSGLAEPIASAMVSVPWLAILGAFMVVSWIASRAAGQAKSMGVQYAALAAFVAAYTLLFVPLLYAATVVAPGAIQTAALITLTAFAGLTWVAFSTRKDFSFLGGLLRWGMILALVAIVGGAIFGFQLGVFFSVGMVGLAGAAILYDTSNVLHHYPEGRYVAASLQLFASVALMLWYVLQLVMSFSSD
ncbi:MAG: Bax inhibitor-1 family protein [Acidobacteriota bacterium]